MRAELKPLSVRGGFAEKAKPSVLLLKKAAAEKPVRPVAVNEPKKGKKNEKAPAAPSAPAA